MFSQECVKNSVHRGVSVPACTTGHMTRVLSLSMGCFCPWGSLSRGGSLSGGTPPYGNEWVVCIGGNVGLCMMSLPVWLPGLTFLLSGSLSGESLSRVASVQRVSVLDGVFVREVSVKGVSIRGVVILSGRVSVQGEAVSVKRGPLLDGDPLHRDLTLQRPTLPPQRPTPLLTSSDGHWSRRCASYWIAFLFIFIVDLHSFQYQRKILKIDAPPSPKNRLVQLV